MKLLLCLILILVLLVLFAVWPGKRRDALRAPFLGRNFAHRGYFGKDQRPPENSLPAFAAAAKNGYGIELDVQFTSDHRLVVFHDDTLDRMTPAKGFVHDMPWAEFSAQPLAGSEEHPPLFADMLRTGAMPQMNQQAGTYYVYPQMLDYLKRADIISVQIGSNDALVPALVALGNATNWKSEQLVATMVSGVLREPSFENLQRLNSDLSRLRLTREERKATTQLLLGGGTDAICEQAYQDAAVHMPQVVAQLRALNPDAQIILVGYTNPVPLLPEWTQLFRRLNALGKSLAAQNENVTYVPIPFTMTAADAHPTVSGHKYIAKHILRAVAHK